jgi:hypothetical protein
MLLCVPDGENLGLFSERPVEFRHIWSETTPDLSQTGYVGYAECVTVPAVRVASADMRHIPPAGSRFEGAAAYSHPADTKPPKSR